MSKDDTKEPKQGSKENTNPVIKPETQEAPNQNTDDRQDETATNQTSTDVSTEDSVKTYTQEHQGEAGHPVDKSDDDITTQAKNALYSQMGPTAPTLPNYDELVKDRVEQIRYNQDQTKDM